MNISQFPKPSVSVDILIFSVQEELKVLLIKRKLEPFKNKWALPGGFVRIDESIDHAASRELEEETGVKNVYLEQLYTFGKENRDPRGRVITVAYFALLPATNQKLAPSTDSSEAKWFKVSEIKSLAFDHKKILEYGILRLKNKILYSSIAYSLLPKEFTLTDLQKIYEGILGKNIDKRNFRKQILKLNLISQIKGKKQKGTHRPAQLYSFKKNEAIIFK